MANYAYITKIRPKLTVEKLRVLLEAAVLDVLGPRWSVSLADFAHDGPTFKVTVPDTAGLARAYWSTDPTPQPGDEDLGFVVSLLSAPTLAFRHGPRSEFESWAQGCIEEELSERLNAPLTYDATDETFQPGRREYRRGKTLREYLLRNYNGVVEDAEHEAFVQRLMRGLPKGFE